MQKQATESRPGYSQSTHEASDEPADKQRPGMDERVKAPTLILFFQWVSENNRFFSFPKSENFYTDLPREENHVVPQQ